MSVFRFSTHELLTDRDEVEEGRFERLHTITEWCQNVILI